MYMQRGNEPYKMFGKELQRIRVGMQESTAEVSGAVEIDTEHLDKYERGEVRPSEDILLLLITHFGIKDEAAARLWELAGYADEKNEKTKHRHEESFHSQQAITILPLDSRVLYTDSVSVFASDHGVILNFMQSGVVNGQPLAVSRVGMSMEHAKSVLEILQKTVDEASRPKQRKSLPAPKSKRSRKDNN
jgi:transcriptional regulator with XRE-family HTH domain